MEKITDRLITWYQENKRDLPWRHTHDPYKIWVSEIMLQQTKVDTVITYYKRFLKRVPTLYDLANIQEDDLLKLWEGLGYYSRIKNMQKTSKLLVSKNKFTLPNNINELLALPGIGKYTAGAILSIAYNIPSIAIDGNVYRVIGRYYGINDSISKSSTYFIYEKYVKQILPQNNAREFTQSFMDLGSMICLPKNPLCESCPLMIDCLAYNTNKVNDYPVKAKKKKQHIEERAIFIFRYRNTYAIQKRLDNGLLASLYEFPNYQYTTCILEIENNLNKQKISYLYVKNIGESKHIFSHVIWNMVGYLIELNKPITSFVWVSKEELMKKYSFPKAFNFYLQLLLQDKI